MPSVARSHESALSSRQSSSSTGSAASSSTGPGLISVGSIALHDNLRCDILRCPIAVLGSKTLSPGQPSFAISRLTLIMRFVEVELDASDTKLRATVTPPSSGKLEYVDARVYLRDSMDPSDIEYFNEPLYLADALGGDKHYERIIRAGTALTSDLKRANENREDCPKARPTGGFIVKEDCPPVVGQLGSQWLDVPDNDTSMFPKRAVSQVQKAHYRTASAFSSFSTASAHTEPSRQAAHACPSSHWECEPCGSGTGEIIFSLRPHGRCTSCNTRPLKLVHSNSAKVTPAEQAASFSKALPNKTFKLVTHLLNMDDGQPPDHFFAHFRIVFYFTDDLSKRERCCDLRQHEFKASIKIGKEGDAQVQQKKEEDFNDALARLEGKIKSAEPQTPRGSRRQKIQDQKKAHAK